MLKIIHFTDKINDAERLTLEKISLLLKRVEDSSLVLCTSGDKSDYLSAFSHDKDITEKTFFADASELFTSGLIEHGDILMPVFGGEFFSMHDAKRALRLSKGQSAVILSERFKKARIFKLEEKPSVLSEFSDNLCMVRFNEDNKEHFSKIDFSYPDEARALLLSYTCLELGRFRMVPAKTVPVLTKARSTELSWYTEEFFARYEVLGNFCLDTYNEVPYFVQYVIGHQLLKRFTSNRSLNCVCEEICTPAERSVFFEKCKRLLKFVDDRVFMRLDGTGYMRFPEPGIAMLCDLKKGKTDLKVCFDAMKTNNNLFCLVDNYAITSLQNKSAVIRSVSFKDNGELHLDVFTNGVFEAMGCEFTALCDGEAVSSYVQNEEILSFFGAPLFGRPVFGVDIPADKLYRSSVIEFKYKYGLLEYKLKIDESRKLKDAAVELELTADCLTVTDERFSFSAKEKKNICSKPSCLLVLEDNEKSEITAESAVEDLISNNGIYSEGKLQIALVSQNPDDISESLKKRENIFFYSKADFEKLGSVRDILTKHGCDFVTHLKVGDITDEFYLDDAVAYAAAKGAGSVVPFVTRDETYIGAENICCDLYERPDLTPVIFSGVFYSSELFFRSSLTPEQWEKVMQIDYADERQIAVFCLLTLENKNTLLFNQHALKPFDMLAIDGKSYTNASEADWYFASVEKFFKTVEGFYSDVLPITIQYTLFNRLLYRLQFNANHQDTHVITPELLPEWKKCISVICQMLDDEVITDVFHKSRFHAPPHISRWLLELKKGDGFEDGVVLLPKNLAFMACDCQILLLSNQTVKIEVMDYTDDSVVIDFSTAGFFERHNIYPQAELNGKSIPLEVSYHYAHRQLFGEDMWKRYTFRVRLPFAELGKKELKFYYITNGYKYPITISTGRYTSKLNRSVPGSYWVCKDFIFSLSKKYYAILINPYSRKLARQKEKELRARCIEEAAYSERDNVRSLMKIRKKYFATKYRFKSKNIWITFDKLYKAGDNADYFYRYAVKQKDGADVHYIINKGYPDAEKFLKDKLKPLYFTEMKHILHFLNSRIVATTHAGLPVFSGVPTKDFKYIQDLFNADVVCIQHGLAVQWMPHNLYAGYDNIKRFYCATQSEFNNLGMPEYDYAPGTLRMTGLSRYDGLVDRSKRQILISPTWRSYIAMPASAGNTRPYSETFKDTEYFRIYNGLINNPKLAETAERCNYHIVYLLHPTLSNQIEDFTPAGSIEVRSPVGESYEKIMTESDLMITDFSGIQFDFAYMRKPLVYYHPDELPAGYGEGGFSYEEQAFGPICKTEQELVDTVCRYMENECKTEEFYLERQNSFFTFNDHENCRRVYEELLEFSRKQRGPEREVVGVRYGGAPVLTRENPEERFIGWTPVEGATQYEVLYSDEKFGFYKTVAFTDKDTCSFSLPEEYEECYIKVRALFCENKVQGNFSNVIYI